MATIATTLPRPRRIQPIASARGPRRVALPDIVYLKPIEVDADTLRECYALLGLGVVVFLFLMIFVWQSFAFVRDGYELESARSDQKALLEWNRQLRVEHAALADPQRIDALARKELGLAIPQPGQVIRLGVDTPAAQGPAEFAQNLPAAGETP
jgi:cell division protein FtsL